MTDDKHIIWSDYNLNFEDWREDLAEQYPGLPESELIDIMYKTNTDYLADERVNLDIQLSRPILIIADIGRWDGRLSGYKEIKSGNIKDCLYSDCDYATWFVDRLGDLRCDAVHHDATNHYLYRVYKDSATESQIDSLKEKIFYNKATRNDIVRITKRLGDEIAKVYGWKIRKPMEQSFER